MPPRPEWTPIKPFAPEGLLFELRDRGLARLLRHESDRAILHRFELKTGTRKAEAGMTYDLLLDTRPLDPNGLGAAVLDRPDELWSLLQSNAIAALRLLLLDRGEINRADAEWFLGWMFAERAQSFDSFWTRTTKQLRGASDLAAEGLGKSARWVPRSDKDTQEAFERRFERARSLKEKWSLVRENPAEARQSPQLAGWLTSLQEAGIAGVLMTAVVRVQLGEAASLDAAVLDRKVFQELPDGSARQLVLDQVLVGTDDATRRNLLLKLLSPDLDAGSVAILLDRLPVASRHDDLVTLVSDTLRQRPFAVIQWSNAPDGPPDAEFRKAALQLTGSDDPAIASLARLLVVLKASAKLLLSDPDAIRCLDQLSAEPDLFKRRFVDHEERAAVQKRFLDIVLDGLLYAGKQQAAGSVEAQLQAIRVFGGPDQHREALEVVKDQGIGRPLSKVWPLTHAPATPPLVLEDGLSATEVVRSLAAPLARPEGIWAVAQTVRTLQERASAAEAARAELELRLETAKEAGRQELTQELGIAHMEHNELRKAVRAAALASETAWGRGSDDADFALENALHAAGFAWLETVGGSVEFTAEHHQWRGEPSPLAIVVRRGLTELTRNGLRIVAKALVDGSTAGGRL